MTSSNVSNLLIQVSSISVETADLKVATPKAGGLFEKTLQNVADSNVKTNVDANEAVSKSENTEIETAAAKLGTTKEATGNLKEEQSTKKDVASKVDETVSEIKEVIEEELDVSEEEIENAMETLGLTMIDLLNPQNLAELVATLTNQEDSISLVMSEEFKNILDSVTQLSEQLFTETGLDFKALKDMEVAMLEPQTEVIADFSETLDMTQSTEKVENIQPEIKVEIQEENLKATELNQLPVEEEQPETVNEIKTEKEALNAEEPEVLVKLKPENEASKNGNESFKNDNFNPPKNTKIEIKTESEPVIRGDNVVFANQTEEVTFLPKEQIVSLPGGQTITSEEIVNQVVEQARILNTTEETTMEMTLNPEGLGKIYMEVTQKGDEITAKIFTENDAVKQALENQMTNLRMAVNQSSTKVTSIEVSVGTHEFERNLEEDAKRDESREDRSNQSQKRSSKINLNNLDELSGLMSEEDMLIAQMMKDNGNTLDFQA